MVQRWCAPCHQLGDAPSASDAAPTLNQIGDLVRKDPERVRIFLSRPHSPMPPLQLGRAEISDIIAYLKTAE